MRSWPPVVWEELRNESLDVSETPGCLRCYMQKDGLDCCRDRLTWLVCITKSRDRGASWLIFS